MKDRVTRAVSSRNRARIARREGTEEIPTVEEAVEELKTARRDFKRKTRQWETDYWMDIVKDCEEAELRGDMGSMYKKLRKLLLSTRIKLNLRQEEKSFMIRM